MVYQRDVWQQAQSTAAAVAQVPMLVYSFFVARHRWIAAIFAPGSFQSLYAALPRT
jgi:hypothetical protein